jgi:hypothetical protein
MALCTPGMGVNLWGASPLYMNQVSENITGTSQLPLGNFCEPPSADPHASCEAEEEHFPAIRLGCIIMSLPIVGALA